MDMDIYRGGQCCLRLAWAVGSRQAACEAGRGSTGRAQRQLAGNFELGATNG